MPERAWRRVARLAAAGFLLLAASREASAQTSGPAALDPDRAITQYLRTVWQRAEGLPQNTVADVLQSRDGYLWLGTQDGLVRFDGVRFLVFNTASDPAVGIDDFTALHEDRAGTLWAGTSGGGLFMVRDGRLQAFSGGCDGGRVIADLHETPDGALWIATNEGLCRLRQGRARTFTTADGLPSDVIRGITADRNGTVWVATPEGVARDDGERFVPAATAPQLPSNDVRVVAALRDGTILIGTARGLVRHSAGTFTTLGIDDGLSGEFIRAILEDARGTVWIGTQDGGVTRIVRGRMDHLRTSDGLTSDDIRSFAADADGNLWIGTNVGGLIRLKEPKVITYGQPEGLPHDIVLPVAADRDGALWTGTYGGGLGVRSNGRWTRYSTHDGLSHDVVLSLAPASGDGMWIGTRAGVDRFEGGRFEHFGPKQGVPDAAVLALIEDRRGTVWIGTRSGAYRLQHGRAEPVNAGGGLDNAIVLAIHEADDGTIWFGTEGAGAIKVDARGRAAPVAAEAGLADGVVWSISTDSKGAMWLATNGRGIIRYRDGRFTAYRARDGLLDDTAFRVIDDGAGSLWISSNRGIQRIARQQFDDFDGGRTRQLAGEFFSEADGMRSSECNGGVQPAGWRTPDGVLWFPTIKGVVRIDPASLSAKRRAPPVVLESIVADGSEYPGGTDLTLEPGVRSIEFRYTALNLGSPEKIRFRYRLEGFDADWVDGGARRAAFYTSLPPDTYTFRVIAAGDDGVWSEKGAVTAVTLAPRFSETRTFYLLLAAVGGLIVFGLHRARVSGLRAREHELARVAEERRWALVALQESEAQFRTLFENVNEGVYRATPQGRLVLANESMARLLAYDTVDDLLRVPLSDLYVDPDEYARLAALVSETGEARAVEMRLRRRDGREVVVLVSVRRVRAAANSLTYYEGALVDITDRKQLEEELLQLQKIESIGRLAGGVAHDVNNLLTPILGQAELLAEELPEDDGRRARVAQIRKAALSARSFTRQLLAFSRKQILKRRVLDLNEAVADVEQILRRLIGEHIELRVIRAPDLQRVRVDPSQLEQVIINLAVNARDAMPTGGTLTIRTENEIVDDAGAAHRAGAAAGRFVVLAVSDTGTGISEEVRTRLFEPFVTTKAHGHGLGLALVHGIVTQSGGHIVVDSEPGRGASFRVYFPAVAEEAVERPAQTAPPQTIAGRTILLVEDDDDVRSIAAEMLERAGYRLLVATDGMDAQQVEGEFRERIDLLLTDVVMPGLGGPALAAILQRRRPDMRVLYTTGYIDDDVAHHGALQPDAMVLEKPFTLDGLLQAVHECLTN